MDINLIIRITIIAAACFYAGMRFERAFRDCLPNLRKK